LTTKWFSEEKIKKSGVPISDFFLRPNLWVIIVQNNLEVRIVLQSQIDEWIEKTDYDSDGRITIEEFKLGMAGSALIDEDLLT